jgi:hypothetical protein
MLGFDGLGISAAVITAVAVLVGGGLLFS